MDEREDYGEPDSGPGWEPAPATLIVVGFAAAVVVACGTLGVLLGFFLGWFR